MTPEKANRFKERMSDATNDDLAFVRDQLVKKTEGGFNRIAQTEAETAKEYIELIDAEVSRREAATL